MKSKIRLIRCKRTNPVYQQFRGRHYIPNHGAVGQQLHYLIFIDDEPECVGIISAGSSVYAVGCRDRYFGITTANREVALNGIVNNTVFRLEKNIPNLGTQVLKAWRRRVREDWFSQYGVRVAGFETFVVENERRKGAMYKADNWQYVGETKGSTKHHQSGIKKAFERKNTGKKLVFCKAVDGVTLPTEYFPTWKHNGIKGQMSLFDDFGLL